MKVMKKKSYGLIIYRKSLVNNKSSMFHLRRKKLQPNKINQHKPRTTARRLNREHSRFKTIDEISKYQQFSNENLNDYSKSEEEDFSRKTILEWVDTAATRKEALQQVHST